MSQLWYTHPAKNWNDALPVGNGKLGAMVFGGVFNEKIQLNEDSCWSGGYRNRNNASAKMELAQIRAFLRQGKIAEAEELTRLALTATPEYQRAYQTLGDLHINRKDIAGEITNYTRCLCLNEATVTTQFTADGFTYTQEVFASFPDNVIAIKMTTDNPQGISLDARLVRNRLCDCSGAASNDTIFMDGTNGNLSFYCTAAGVAVGGSLRTIGEYLVFTGCKEVVIYVTATTSFRSQNMAEDCYQVFSNVKNKGYITVRNSHLTDYQALESRVKLQLDDKHSHIPTDQRLTAVKQGKQDDGLFSLYFRYGRYLLIACSRAGSLPANLQGIWCNDFLPPWDSKYTININTEMNYWPAEICNLADCHTPLFDHIHRMHPNGSITAQEMYGARGFVAHHNTDIWGDTAPQDTWTPATYWVMGAAWLCLHIWEHYEYNLDKGFLSQHFNLISDACLFFVDFLIENENGHYIVSPTISPENTYILPNGKHGVLCQGCAMDGQILHELFTAYINAAWALGYETNQQFVEILENLPPILIGKNGGIMEWLQDYGEAEPGHRHMSHLFALFPGSQISPESTPDLATAARKTLELRLSQGGGHTGWSRAWIINFYVRLGDAAQSYFHLNELLCHSTLPNLFDNHPPFQIDGNFGATAAIAFMLLQSDGKHIHLLKALPQQWQNGSVTGLCAKGGLVVDIEWQNGKMASAIITAAASYSGTVLYSGKAKQIDLKQGETIKIGADML